MVKKTKQKSVKTKINYKKRFGVLSILIILLVLPICITVAKQQTPSKNAYAATPQPIGPSGNWNLSFDDEFSATSLNTSVWTPGWFGTGITGPTNSGETACYNSTQVSEPGDGYLHLNLISHISNCSSKSHPYTGSLVSSNPDDGVSGHNGFQYTYGYVEWRVYLPPTTSSSTTIANWPAIWSDGQNWPTDGENDTMEGLGGQACYHFHSPSGGPGNCITGNYTGWHTFGADWEPGSVTYYYDGIQIGQITSGITTAPQYLIMDNTQGSAGGPTLTPSTMLVDYVRVWQKCTTTCVTSAPSNIPTPTMTPIPTPTIAPTANPTPTATPLPTATSCSGLTVTAPLTLNKTNVSRGSAINGTVTYTNKCSTNYTATDILIYAQNPSGTHYDFAPESGSITLKPNQSKIISASLTLPRSVTTGKWTAISSYESSLGLWTWDSADAKAFSVK